MVFVPAPPAPTVGVTATPTTLIESEQTVIEVTFTTEGEIPPEGLVVQLAGATPGNCRVRCQCHQPPVCPKKRRLLRASASRAVSIVGTDEVAGGRCSYASLTPPGGRVTVPVFDDGPGEGTEVLPFTLVDGEDYCR